jgi:hypothetical protein
MNHRHKLARAALVTAIAIGFGAAPALAQSPGNAGSTGVTGSSSSSVQGGAAGAHGTTGAHGGSMGVNDGSKSMQDSRNVTTPHGTSSAAAGTLQNGAGSATTSPGVGTNLQSEGRTTATDGSSSSNSRAGSRGSPDNIGVKDRADADSLDAWMNRHATEHQGRVSRQAYMDEMARRWDSLDRSKQGLTPAEISRLTGRTDLDHAGPARTGSAVQPGNMGPGNVKGQ